MNELEWNSRELENRKFPLLSAVKGRKSGLSVRPSKPTIMNILNLYFLQAFSIKG